MRFQICAMLAVAAILGPAPLALAQRSSDKVKTAQSAVDKAKKQLKQAEAALAKAQADAKKKSVARPDRRGPQRSRASRFGGFGGSRRGRFGGRSSRRGPAGDEMKKRMEAFQKSMKERMEKFNAARARKPSDGKPTTATSKRPGFPFGPRSRGRFGGSRTRGFPMPKKPGFGRRPGFRGPAKAAKSSKQSEVEKKLDKLAKELEALREELKK